MNCANCGQVVAPGSQVCPYCGAMTAPYPVQHYPTGYQQPYPYAQPVLPQRRGALSAIAELPHSFLCSFTQPGDVLRSMVESRDLVTAPIVAGLVLILSFLGGVVMMRGFVGELFKALSALTGVSMASNNASMNQGISYIASRVGAMTGGIAALCQLICMLVPVIVFMVYICLIRKVTFSFELALGFLAVLSLNTVVVSLLAMALSLLSPWLSLIVMACGAAVSYTQANGMLGFITGVHNVQLTGGKIACTALSLFLSLLLCMLVGGWLMGGVMQRILVLLSSVGSLI